MADRTRAEMESIIARGGSVILKSGCPNAVTNGQLPSAPVKAKLTKEQLLAEKTAIDAELAELDATVA